MISKEVAKRKLYTTFYRLGLSDYYNIGHNIYVDDSGHAVAISPDGITELMGIMDFSGELVCNPIYLDN